MANIENKHYRTMLDYGDVLKNSLTQVLLTELVASEKLTKSEVADLSKVINNEVSSCFSNLIDRLQSF